MYLAGIFIGLAYLWASLFAPFDLMGTTLPNFFWSKNRNLPIYLLFSVLCFLPSFFIGEYPGVIPTVYWPVVPLAIFIVLSPFFALFMFIRGLMGAPMNQRVIFVLLLIVAIQLLLAFMGNPIAVAVIDRIKETYHQIFNQ